MGALVLHGFGGTPATVRPLAKAFVEAGWSVESPRLPGHGTSLADLLTTGWEQWAAETERAYRTLAEHTTSIVVAGTSMGAALVLDLAIRHESVAGVVCVNPKVVPESADTAPGYTVLLAENRLDGTPLATVRLQTNEYGPLALEGSIELPSWLRGRKLAEATRLAVAESVRGRFVTLVMFKAFFQFCLEEEVEWMVVGARPPLDRIYRSLTFHDVVPGGGFVSLQHTGGIPHRVLAFNVARAEALWRTASHPLYAFMGLTLHPDINVGLPGPSAVPKTAYYRDRIPTR
jgi:pimeloyl-ACP methyl ester carboxylesterase